MPWSQLYGLALEILRRVLGVNFCVWKRYVGQASGGDGNVFGGRGGGEAEEV